MSHFTNEHFNQLQRSREQCISFLGMSNERLENFRTFDDLHQRIYGYKPEDKQALLEKQEEVTLQSYRHANSHQKWHRVIKALLRSAGLPNLNNTIARLIMESNKRKYERLIDEENVTSMRETPNTYDPPAIFPIFKFIQHEVKVGDNGDSVSFLIFHPGYSVKNLSANLTIPVKYQILVQNIFYTKKQSTSLSKYKSIPHTEGYSPMGLLVIVDYDDIRELKNTEILLKVNIVFVPLTTYTNVTNEPNIVYKKEEPETKSGSKFVKELNEKAIKLSKQSLPPRPNILPRY